MKRLLLLLSWLPMAVGLQAQQELVLDKPETLSSITPWQNANVRFTKGETVDPETFMSQHTMGALTLTAPATPKWQIGSFLLPVDYFSYEFNYKEGDWEHPEKVYEVGALLNQSTQVEARQIAITLTDPGDNYWLVFSVPFDVNVDDIQAGVGNWVIRRYDGANRAALKAGQTWIDVKPGEQLHAGETYIFMRDYSNLWGGMSKKKKTDWDDDDDWGDDDDDDWGDDDDDWGDDDDDDWGDDDFKIVLSAAATSNAQNIFVSGDVVVPLKKYAAERPHNANWNFVGNPYPCYYDLSAIKEKVDLYFWDGDYQMFRVFSTAQDNGFVLGPGQGFFVQANDISQLTFPASGRRISGSVELPEMGNNFEDDDWGDEEWSTAARAQMQQLRKQMKAPQRMKRAAGDFNPASPVDPGANYFNPLTGEAVFDLFEPGSFVLAASNLFSGENSFKSVKSVTVEAPLGKNFMFMLFMNCERIDISRSGGFSTLPAGSFTYMPNLREVALPACVTAIDPEAFLLCMGLEQIDCYATTPPTLSETVLTNMQNSNLDNLVVRVPKEAVTAYKKAPVWKTLNIQSLEGGEVLQSVTMAVLTPEGRDIAGQCSIVWRADDGTMLGSGSELLGVAEGTKVTYSVSLPSVLVTVYEPVAEGTHTVTASDNQVTVNLVATGVIDLGSLDLRGSVGTLTFDYVPSDDTSATFSTNDVRLTISDKATATALTDFVCQYPEVYFEKTRLTQGQVVTVTATSRSGAFQPTEAEATADADGNFSLTMTLRENGHARLTCTRDEGVTSVMAMVFNGDGNYVGRYAPNGNVITVSGLDDGNYVAVVMQETPYFTVVPTAADLELAGLIKDIDFAYTLISLKAGTSKDYNMHVPYLDEERLKRIDPASYLTTTTPSLTLMQTGTLKAKVVSKADYMAKVSNLRLIIDFPEGTHYQEGSLITTKSDGSYQLSGRRLVVPCEFDEQVKCCLVPDQSGKYNITAMAQYTMDGQQYTQPIGVTVIDVAYTSLNLPNPTNTPTLHPNGYTYPNSTVTIYDGDYVIGETTANSNGFFETDVTLRPAYDDTYHQVHAIAKREGAEPVALESQLILYDKDASMISEVSMIYQGQRITWNKLNGTYTPHYYDVNPANSGRATFTAKLLNPQPDKILFPAFEVATSDGKGYRLSAKWNAGSQTYTATHKFPDVECLPIGAQFHFQYADPAIRNCEEMSLAEANYLVGKHNSLVSDLDQCLNYGDVVTDEDTKTACTFTIGNDPTVYLLTAQDEDFDRIDAMRQNDYVFMRLQGVTDSLGTYTFGDDRTLTTYYLDFTNREAWSTIVSIQDGSASPSASRRRVTALGALNGMAEIGNLPNKINKAIEDIKKTGKDIVDLEWSYTYLQNLKRSREFYTSSLGTMLGNCSYLLFASCPDGTSKVPESMLGNFQTQYTATRNQNDLFYRQMDALIESYEVALRNRVGTEYVSALASAAVGKGVTAGVGKALMKGKRVLYNVAKTGLGTFKECFKFIQDGASGTLNDLAGKAGNEALKELHLPTDFMNVKNYFEKWAPEEYQKRGLETMQLADAIKASYKECEEEDDDDDDGDDDGDDEDPEPVPHPQVPHPVTPIVDPSGFVYEGVEGNRVEGVTATIFYKENEGGAEHQWDAEEFGQQNPQVTNVSGVYMWNVPKGLWQVRFTKSGYEPAQTEWLPVPPPQLDIMVPMTQHGAPVVTKAGADENGVSVSFSKYMQTASLSGITVRQNGAAVSGDLLFPEAENGLTNRVRFVAASPFTAQEVQLTVPAEAKSYAGDAMAAADVRTLTVERVVEDLLVQTDAAIQVGQVGYLQVTAYPAIAVAGRQLTVSVGSPLVELAEGSLTFDEHGQVLVPLRGLLPGTADVSCTIGDLVAKANVRVKYVVEESAAKPMPSIVSGSVVAKGTQVELFCATPGAVIWYTTDGSCPCDEGTRQRYTGPITIDADVTIRAMAVCDGLADSDVMRFTYTVGDPSAVETPAINWQSSPVTNIYDLSGKRVTTTLPRGLYIHVQRTPQGIKTRKVVVK